MCIRDRKELFKYVDPENVPADLGGECECPESEGGCYSSHKGPWNDHPADEYGEAAKEKILELKKKEENKAQMVVQDSASASDSEVGAGVPSFENNREVSVNMVNVDIEANRTENDSKVQNSTEERVIPDRKKKKRSSIFCCGRKRYESDDE